MKSLRSTRSLLNAAAAFIVAGTLLLSTGCGSDDDGEKKTSSGADESTPVTPEPPGTGTETESTDPFAPLKFGVTGFDPATGELSGFLSESTQNKPLMAPDDHLIVNAETEIVVQGPERAEKLPLAELKPWIAQRLTDLGETADSVAMELTYKEVEDQFHVVTLTEVPPG